MPGKDFAATVDLISVLAKVDFIPAGRPAGISTRAGAAGPIPQIRPGMTATARIAAERVPNTLVAPSEAIFQHDGRPVVYRLNGSMFDEQRIEMSRRGREQVAIAAGVAAGDACARGPEPELIRRKK